MAYYKKPLNSPVYSCLDLIFIGVIICFGSIPVMLLFSNEIVFLDKFVSAVLGGALTCYVLGIGTYMRNYVKNKAVKD